MEDIYVRNGFKNRAEYLERLAEDYGVDFEIVGNMALILGPEEDFDALVSFINDAADMGYKL